LHPPGDDKWGYEKAEERWLPIHTVESILISVISMLSDPNDQSPANLDAAVRFLSSVLTLVLFNLLLDSKCCCSSFTERMAGGQIIIQEKGCSLCKKVSRRIGNPKGQNKRLLSPSSFLSICLSLLPSGGNRSV